MAVLSSGKLTNLLRLADASGRFKMLAIDQRDSLRIALGNATRREPQDITYEDMATAKALITEVLAPYATAALVDPIYGWPRAVKAIPGDVAMLVATEDTGMSAPAPVDASRGWSMGGRSPRQSERGPTPSNCLSITIQTHRARCCHINSSWPSAWARHAWRRTCPSSWSW